MRISPTLLAGTVMLAASAVFLVHAQGAPKLASYFTEIPQKVVDPTYAPLGIAPVRSADLSGDGREDLVVLGLDSPGSGVTNVAQPGRLLLGDGDGNFTLAPADLFPVGSLMTVHPRKVLFADFNRDGRQDMFISSHGWDVVPFPGEQNRLYMSRSQGGWSDATSALPQLNDYSHTSAVGDISNRGVIDIFVGNGYSGANKILPYTLLNTGSGQFTLTRTNIPAGPNQIMDTLTQHHFPGAELADLNGDALPELILTADSGGGSIDKLRRSTILWNHEGVFAETDITELPVPAPFPNFHVDHDVQRVDVNQDGRPDLVLVGRQSLSFGGWFVQVLVNQGNRQFVDETSSRMAAADASAGTEGVPNSTPWAAWVKVIDFNQDGAPDFSVEFSGTGGRLDASQPLIWLNDGTGHFSTFKVSDFVVSGKEQVLGSGHLVLTRYGYSFVTPQYFKGSGLLVTGMLANKRKLPAKAR